MRFTSQTGRRHDGTLDQLASGPAHLIQVGGSPSPDCAATYAAPSPDCYVSATPAAKREAHLNGKWLLRTSDLILTEQDLDEAYKQLLVVEAGWRGMKNSLGLLPVHHRREDRIRGHVQLCWLALLLIESPRNTTGDTWRNLRHELDRMALGHPGHQPRRHGPMQPDHSSPTRHPGSLEVFDPPKFFDFTPAPTDLTPDTGNCRYTPQSAADHILPAQRPFSAMYIPTICGAPARPCLPIGVA